MHTSNRVVLVFLVAALTAIGFSESMLAQSPPTPQSTPAGRSEPLSQTSPQPALNARELQGLDVFASGGQQLGKVTKVNTASDGTVKEVEVQSSGFLGLFKTTYAVPAEKLKKKGGRIELSMTGDQAKDLVR
jgi:hypothetical protein